MSSSNKLRIWASCQWHHHWSFIIRFNATEQKAVLSQQHYTHTHYRYTTWIWSSVWSFSRTLAVPSEALGLQALFCLFYILIFTNWCGRQQITDSHFILVWRFTLSLSFDSSDHYYLSHALKAALINVYINDGSYGRSYVKGVASDRELSPHSAADPLALRSLKE